MYRRISMLVALSLILVSCSLVSSGDGNNPPTMVEQSPQLATATALPEMPTETAIPEPTFTPVLTPTQVITATDEITPALATQEAIQYAPEEVVSPRYVVQSGTPLAVGNFVQSDAGCNWTGIGGQVFGPDEMPVKKLIVEVSGTLEGQDVLFLAITGSAPEIGPGGFAITLTNHTVDSDGSLYIQLFDLQGEPQSELIPFQTFANCNQNMILMNFTTSTDRVEIYLPSIYYDDPTKTP